MIREKIQQLMLQDLSREEIIDKMGWSERQFYWNRKKFFPDISFRSLKKVNHLYFEKINTHKKAYLLGFFIADGHLRSQRTDKQLNCFIVSVKREDEIILKFFISEICPEATLQHSKLKNGYEISKIQWTSVNMAKDISKYISNFHRKSYNENLDIDMSYISDEFFPSFLRGLIDGDGTVKLNFPRVELLFSSNLFANKLKMRILNLLPSLNVRIVKDNSYSKKDNKKRSKTLYRLHINSSLGSGGNGIKRYLEQLYYIHVFYNFLYYNSEFFLQRKKSRFTEYRANFLNNE